MTEHGDADVCTDCYFAHHYGATEHGGQWFAGEEDIPCDREPLNLLSAYELADNTDSETGEGMTDFTWRSCEGCGSTLGGSRFRLATFTPREISAPLATLRAITAKNVAEGGAIYEQTEDSAE